jgi:hypothetical protein
MKHGRYILSNITVCKMLFGMPHATATISSAPSRRRGSSGDGVLGHAIPSNTKAVSPESFRDCHRIPHFWPGNVSRFELLSEFA